VKYKYGLNLYCMTQKVVIMMEIKDCLGGDVEGAARDVVITPLDNKSVFPTVLDEVAHHSELT